MQIRNFKYSKRVPKYITYRLGKIWEDFIGKGDPEFLKSLDHLNEISTIFGISNLNFNRMITVFEGPFDSFLFPNSVALCSINNRFPFDIENKRWFLDDDKAGKDKAMKIIQEGESVFMWEKFKKENDLVTFKIKDLNKLVIHLKVNNKKIKRLENYFSRDKLDLINI